MAQVTNQLRKVALQALSTSNGFTPSKVVYQAWNDANLTRSKNVRRFAIRALEKDGCIELRTVDPTQPPSPSNTYLFKITDKGLNELVNGRTRQSRVQPRIRSQRYLTLLDILETGKGLTIDQIGEVTIPDYDPTDFKRKQYAYSVMNAFKKAVLSKTPHTVIKNGKFYELSTPETAFIGALDKRDKFLPHLTSIQAHITKEIETYKNDPKLAGQLELLVLDLQDKVTKIRRDQLTSGK
mgnify:CR=1 FL=1